MYCDNKTTMDFLCVGILRSEFSQACSCNILHSAASNDFQIRAVHISGVTNHKSDCLSRWNLGEKYRQEFWRLTKDIQTAEITITDAEFVDLY